MHISEQLIRSTVFISAEIGAKILQDRNCPATQSDSTGFFFEFDLDNKKELVIVTNKHAIANAKTFYFSIITKRNKNTYEPAIMRCENPNLWITHPDSNIDLALLPLKSIPAFNERFSDIIFMNPLTKDIIPQENQISDISYIENIITIGYPNGRRDRVNGFPIVTHGITSTPIMYNYNNYSGFLIDAIIEEGSSGSPVFVFDPINPERCFLVGIIQGFNNSMPLTTLNLVIHSQRLLDFIPLLKLQS